MTSLRKKIVLFAACGAAVFSAVFSAAAQDAAQKSVRSLDGEKKPLVRFEIGRDGDDTSSPVTVDLSGTVRAKMEYQPSVGNARFNVRTARFGISGTVYTNFSYKMEIDLSDEGRIKMVDAWVGARIYKGLSFNIGFMRVPFTIDAHRSPHLQMFANRSFIAKQMGNVRDVGATLGWKFGVRIPVNVQVGVFNGSGLDEDLRNYWTRSFNYSAKVQAGLLPGMNAVAGYQTTLPDAVRIHMYDAGVNYQTGRWFFEAEYLRKNYSHGAFSGVDGVDAFLSYGVPIRHEALRRISLLGRWDYMGDHSTGIAGPTGALTIDDIERHRATLGVTFSLGLPFSADIRVNYEKYFYDRGALPAGPSDHDKIVVELMAHF